MTQPPGGIAKNRKMEPPPGAGAVRRGPSLLHQAVLPRRPTETSVSLVSILPVKTRGTAMMNRPKVSDDEEELMSQATHETGLLLPSRESLLWGSSDLAFVVEAARR